MKLIEINSEYFAETEKSKFADYVQSQPKADMLILDCRRFFADELKTLVELVRTRYIIYGFANVTQENLLSQYGHFNLTKIWNSADFIKQVEFMFHDGFLSRGFAAPYEGIVFSKSLMKKADFVERHGRYELEIEGNFSESEEDEVPVFRYSIPAKNWMGTFVPFHRIAVAGTYLITLDAETTGTLKVIQRISSFDKAGKLLKRDDLHPGDNIFDRTEDTASLFIQLLLSGKGRLHLGKTWLYKYRHDLGYFVTGDHRDYTSAGEPVYSYFIPGKLRKKLLVGFSGALNEVPYYERRSMAQIGFPTLLFTDMRERGGCMMLGKEMDPAYENLVESIIDEKLRELGLTRQDLIFTGWSMGSFPALYYGMKMGAGDIIPCKPVVHLGKVTSNIDLIYKTDAMFLTARTHLTGRTDKSDDDRLNAVLPELAEKCNLRQTRIHAFLMENDELDNSSVFMENLRSRLAHLEVEKHKGFHGDGSPQMAAFITKILNRIKAEVEN